MKHFQKIIWKIGFRHLSLKPSNCNSYRNNFNFVDNEDSAETDDYAQKLGDVDWQSVGW